MDLQLTVIKLLRCETKRTAQHSIHNKINRKKNNSNNNNMKKKYNKIQEYDEKKVYIAIVHIHIKPEKDQNWTDWRARTLAFGHWWWHEYGTKSLLNCFIHFFYVLFFMCFSFFVCCCCCCCYILLINQIQIEIIFRIHMPGQINQKRGKKYNNNSSTKKKHETTAKAQNKDRWFSYPLSGKLRIAAWIF